MISPIEVAFVTACTALISSFFAPLITFQIGRAQIKASVLSNNRQRWIETLRDLIASFCAQAVAVAPLRSTALNEKGLLVTSDLKTLEKLEAILKTFTKIRLMTNPHEADHQELVAVLTRIVTTLRTAPLDNDLEPGIQELIEAVVTRSQAILKREWVRVKRGE